MREVDPEPTRGEREAHTLLFTAAIALVSNKNGETFPVDGPDLKRFVAAGEAACKDFTVVKPGGKWPADLLGQIAMVVAGDGSAFLLMTDMLRPGAFPGSGEDPADALPEAEFLSVLSDGACRLGSGGMTTSLLALVPERQSP